MLKNLFIILFILNSYFINAQNIAKAYKYLDNGEMQKAEKIFDKAIKKRKNLIAAEYGKAIILAKSTEPKYTKIYQYLINIKQRYPLLKQDKKIEYQNYGLSTKSIDTLKNWVLKKEYIKATKSNDLATLNLFLTLYAGTRQAKKIKKIRDSLLFNNIKKQNTIEAYKKFIENYPESAYNNLAIKKRDSLWKKEYYKAYKNYELYDIKKFDKKYPDYPFYDDSTKIYTSLAIQAADLQLQMGYIKGNKNYYSKFIKAAAPSELAFQALLTIIQPDLEQNNLNSAIDSIEKYKKYFKTSKKINQLIFLLKNPDKNVISKSIGKQINTPAYEYMPVLSADGKTLYFCAEGRPENIGQEDIFVSHFKNGQWTKPKIVKALSSPYKNEAPLSVSADGNTILIFVNGDIFISHKTKTGWSKIKPIKQINTSKYWEADAFITADGNAILFSSDRKGNIGSFHPINHRFHGDFIGNLDIYVIVKQKDGSWSKPINLGPTINTPYAERTPFLHPDMKTLYFASDGHTGLGKMDIFKSTRLSDTSWTKWSKPVNLGFGINSSKKEYGYKISTDGTKAFYAKFFNGQADIFYLTLPKKTRPEKVLVLSGYISDKQKNPLDANIYWENLENFKKLGQLKSNPQNGHYTITLPLGKNYGIYVSKNGYYPVSYNINLTKHTDTLKITKNFRLTQITKIINGQASVKLNNVFFDYDKYDLKKESYPELNRLAAFLKKHPDIKIEISGHTDSIGTEQYNLILSQKRAESVKNYLIELGCKANQLISKGYGSMKPIADNSSEKGRKQNRRVEFKVIK
jgi:outer membrane protein OmpA-like peptidoglycan-associated protein